MDAKVGSILALLVLAGVWLLAEFWPAAFESLNSAIPTATKLLAYAAAGISVGTGAKVAVSNNDRALSGGVLVLTGAVFLFISAIIA